MAVIGGLDPQTGEPRTIVLRPDGRLPVEDVGDGGPSIEALLLQELVWEAREFRRLYCDVNKKFFKEYSG